MRPGFLALFVVVWIFGAFLGSTFEYQNSVNGAGISYTTGTATFTKYDATVEGAGTAWNATMVGGNIKADVDGTWYRIFSVTDGTHLELASLYIGTTGGGLAYTMAESPGWAGTGSGGYNQYPVTTLTYLSNINNAFQKLASLGDVPVPVPNPDYFKSMFKVLTWQWSFMDGYEIFYWIFLSPFVIAGIFSMIILGYGLLVGNLNFS